MSRPEFTNDRLGILHGITQDEAPPHSAPSPKRAKKSHRSSRSHSGDDKDRDRDNDGNGGRDRDRKSKKFRFKKPHRSKEKERTSSSRHTSSSTSKTPRDKYHAPLDDDPTAYDDSYIPNLAAWNSSSGGPDAAFRESLFDAMADDEGAAFWEGVYGQPIHVYQRPPAKDERGELEMMDDEDYAKYVREKMWEKSHEHIMEERVRRESKRERRKKEEEEERVEWEREEKERRVRDKLRREKRSIEKMRARWEEYAQYWEAHAKGPGGGDGGGGGIPWPVASGKSRDVTREAVEEFILAASGGRSSLADVVKVERIRWHPDKAQQRWGRDALGEMEMRAVTTVFQTLDALWAEHKKQNEKPS
ncbi:hypothetical protein BZA05DRAFT_384031 [Tricharina praecox]|uniref:uncharacterized protein n=1 Tax=Tricharina praecox TaxID=43433 RepID=UPI00221EED91|nr:uncharacterized protein BZA05DRAFT_384031 [Tricharina praecox]KAI5857580.1 hypothetical protein BZA05DRAFT_384031 [Tricharina praecox]